MKILDSDHWVALLCGRLDLRRRVVPDDELAITAISVGVVHGAQRSQRPAESLMELGTLLASITILPTTPPHVASAR